MATYISGSDITDSLLLETGLAPLLAAKVTASDAEVEDLAERKGVDTTDIETSPVHYLIKKYAVAWVCMSLCADLAGKNKNDGGLEADIYNQKYKIYKQQVTEYANQITYEVLTGDVDESRERVGPRTGTILLAG